MSQSRLELRSLPMIIAAYFVAPLVILVAPFIWWEMTDPAARASAPFAAMAGVGAVAALLILELIFATPLLAGVSRYRWPWLNGWTGCAIGVLIALILSVLLGGLPTAGAHGQHITIRANGSLDIRTGWDVFLNSQANAVFNGLVVGLAFRLVAFRKASH